MSEENWEEKKPKVKIEFYSNGEISSIKARCGRRLFVRLPEGEWSPGQSATEAIEWAYRCGFEDGAEWRASES